ncbi:MAG: hypothetical protein U0Z17_04410 [Bacteroidales bacterium]
MMEITYRDGEFNGPYRFHYPGGSLEYEKIYAGGLMNGPSVHYYADGKKEYEGTYTDCRETGTDLLPPEWNKNERR